MRQQILKLIIKEAAAADAGFDVKQVYTVTMICVAILGSFPE